MDTLLHAQTADSTFENESDEGIAARALTDPDAFTLLYRANALDIYRYCYRRLQDREAAEDATSQTFINAYAGLRRLGNKPFRPWLYAIAHNVVVDAHRARRLHLPLDATTSHEAPAPLPEDLVIDREQRDVVLRVLQQLPKRDREVVELRLAGLSGLEIAETLHCSHQAVRTAHYRAVQRIRELLENEGLVDR
jgi:RNA polymerase sigma-70 factor (ECF subfamily)